MISAATWASIIVSVLKIASAIMAAAQRNSQFAAGQDRQIADQARATLEMTAYGKRLMEKIDGMNNEDLDKLLDDLGH